MVLLNPAGEFICSGKTENFKSSSPLIDLRGHGKSILSKAIINEELPYVGHMNIMEV